MKWNIHRVEACDSTQDEARKRAQDGAPDGTVVVAASMSDGVGQHGRAWHAPEGGLYASIVLRDIESPLLTLALGNAVGDVLEVAGAQPALKWVNDVWVDGRKLAGILVEGESTGDTLDFVLAGIGINVNGHAADWPHPLNGSAVTLEDVLGAESCVPDLEAFLFEALEKWVGKVRDGRGDEVVAAWRQRDALKGTRVGFDPDGDFCSKLVGTAAGIDDEGRFLLEVDGQVQAFASGTVTPAADGDDRPPHRHLPNPSSPRFY